MSLDKFDLRRLKTKSVSLGSEIRCLTKQKEIIDEEIRKRESGGY